MNKHPQQERQDIPEMLKPVIDLIPKEKINVAIARLSSVSYSYSGPFPPPAMLEHYQKLYHDAAKVLFERFEEQDKHRIELEKAVIHAQLKESARGQNLAFLISLVIILISAYLVTSGHPWVGGVFGSTTVLSLVGMFIYGKKQQAKELQEK